MAPQRGGARFAVMLFSAGTGVLLAAPDVWPAPAMPMVNFAASDVQIDAAVVLAQAQFPDARIRDIRFPPDDRIAVNFFAPERNPRAVHVVVARLSAPEVLKSLPAADNNFLWMKVLPLHTGDSLGIIARLVLLAEAVVLAALAVTGPWMWWKTRKRSR